MANKPVRLNLGAGIKAYKGWINVDKYITEKDVREHKGAFKRAIWQEGAKWVQADILSLPFPDNYADEVEMHEVLEHFMFRDVIPALAEIRRVMKPEATLILNCPSFDGIAADWLRMAVRKGFDEELYTKVMETVVGNQRGIGEVHQCVFNMDYLNHCLVQAGFRKGELRLHYKGDRFPNIGKLYKSDPKIALRNDILVAKVTK